jgi:hypothetical protein
MAFLVLLFLDLGLPIARKGNDGLYQQAMIDHRLKGPITTDGPDAECLAWNGYPIPQGEIRRASLFSRVFWNGDTAYFQINAPDAIYCSLYRRSGASYRLVRDVRFPR